MNDLRPNRRRRSTSRPHADLIVHFWSRVLVAVTKGEAKLRRFKFEWEYAEIGSSMHRPDAVMRLSRTGPTRDFWVEADCNATESPSVVAKKVRTFQRMRTARIPVAGVKPEVMLLLVCNRRRARSIARSAPAGAPVLVRVFDDKTESLALLDGWWLLNDSLVDGPEKLGLL